MAPVQFDSITLKGRLDVPVGTAAAPTIVFGSDMDTGFFQSAATKVAFSAAGTTYWEISSTQIRDASKTNSAALRAEEASATNPVLTFKADSDTGIGAAAGDALSLISGAIESMRLTETSSHVIQTHEAHVGLTADTGSIQGGLPLLSTYNVISTSGTAGDSCTLPAVFGVGTKVTIKNDAAANAVDVFPASGDNLGAGANTAASLGNGASITYLATVANSTWTSIGN